MRKATITDIFHRMDKYLTSPEVKVRGIYFLIKNNEVVYVGRSMDVVARLCFHRTRFNFDFIRVIPYSGREFSFSCYEKRWIKLFCPKYNRMSILFDRNDKNLRYGFARKRKAFGVKINTPKHKTKEKLSPINYLL